MTLTHRPYAPADRAACLAVFDSNVPRFFLPAERADYEQDLDEFEAGKWGDAVYLVLKHEDGIAACGGIYVREDGRAGLAWGMVSAGRHRRGLGSLLLEVRLDWARARPHAREVWLDTSQHSAPFFARFGFEVVNNVLGGYGPGMDKVEMRLRL